MQIKSLEKMEKIVSQNRSLSWSGWDVVHAYPSDNGRTSKFGAYINNKWHITRKFLVSRDGWDIPDKFIR
jgi:hypothetical protein